MECGTGSPDFLYGFPATDHYPVLPALLKKHGKDIGCPPALREDLPGFIRRKGEAAAGEPCHEVPVRKLPEGGPEERTMIPVLSGEIADLPVMGKIALPGAGDQELPPAGEHLFEEEHPLPGSCRFSCAEEPGRPSPYYNHGMIVHNRNYSLRQLFDVSDRRVICRKTRTPAPGSPSLYRIAWFFLCIV